MVASYSRTRVIKTFETVPSANIKARAEQVQSYWAGLRPEIKQGKSILDGNGNVTHVVLVYQFYLSEADEVPKDLPGNEVSSTILVG